MTSPQPFDALKENLFSTLEAPTESTLPRPLKICPICGAQTKWQGVDLVCDNTDCISQLIKQVAYFYSKTGFDLKSIGENMIAQLILDPDSFKIIVNQPWALLDPWSFELLPYLYNIWGTKKTDNYLNSLLEINERKNVAHFLSAMGYPGLAYKTALKIFYFIKEGIVNSNIPKKAQTAFLEAYLKFQTIESLIPNFKFAPLPESPKVTYCITGSLATARVDLIDYLTKFRWEWSNQVSRYVDYLIIGADPGKTKITKANELGTLTLTEEEFMEMIKK